MQRSGWTCDRLGPLDLWRHPECDLQVIQAVGQTFAFIGDVYVEDPADGGLDRALAERVSALGRGDDAALYSLLDTLAGRFALLLIEDDRVRVFHDAMGARSVFYHEGPSFAVASHAALLAEATGAEVCPDVAAHCAHPDFPSRKTNSLPGDSSLFRNIYALVPNNCFDSLRMCTTRYWPREPVRSASLSQFYERLDVSMKSLARFVDGRYEPVIGLTGGVDARVALAAFQSLNISFETVTWKLALIPEKELTVIAKLADMLSASHRYADGAPHIKRISAICRRNAHPTRKRSSVAADAWALYYDRPKAVFLRGFGAEIMRGYFNLERSPMTALTPGEMARLYFSPNRARPIPADTEGFFEDYYKRGNYAGMVDVGGEASDLFYWEHRMGMWGSLVHNELDVAMRSIPIFNTRQLYQTAWGLPREKRLTKQLLLDAVSRYAPELAQVHVMNMGKVGTPLPTTAAGQVS